MTSPLAPGGVSRRSVLKAGALLPLAGCARPSRDNITTLEFWTLSLQPFAEYIRAQIDAFERTNPGVRVDWVDVPFDAMERKLVAATAAKRSPDVVNMSDLTFARFASLGAFEDLGPIQPAPAEGLYLDGALSMCRIDERLRAVPWYLTTQAVLANAELLAEGGLDPDTVPNRWNELLALAPSFRERTGRFLFSHPLGHESQLPSILLAEGVPLFEQIDGGSIRATLANERVLGALDPWVRAFRDGDIPREAATQGHAHLVEGYQSGRLALINTGPNFLGRISDVAPSVFNATIVRPAVTGTLGRPHISVMTLGVMSKSRHPELAAKLVWHMTSPETQLAFCEIVNILPSTPASLNAPLFQNPVEASTPADRKIAEARQLTASALPEAVAFTPALAAWPDMRRAFEDQIVRVFLGTQELAPALEIIEEDWNRLLVAMGGGSIDAIPMPRALGASA